MASPNEEYQPCARRQQLTQFNADGSRERIQRCTEKSCKLFGKTVTPENCQGCSVRVEVTKTAMKAKEYKPPLLGGLQKVIATRPDKDPPAEWPECKDRQVATAVTCCGSQTEHRICNSIDCFRLGSKLAPAHCRTCPHRH